MSVATDAVPTFSLQKNKSFFFFYSSAVTMNKKEDDLLAAKQKYRNSSWAWQADGGVSQWGRYSAYRTVGVVSLGLASSSLSCFHRQNKGYFPGISDSFIRQSKAGSDRLHAERSGRLTFNKSASLPSNTGIGGDALCNTHSLYAF